MEINTTSLDTDVVKPEGTAHLFSQSGGPTTLFLFIYLAFLLLCILTCLLFVVPFVCLLVCFLPLVVIALSKICLSKGSLCSSDWLKF